MGACDDFETLATARPNGAGYHPEAYDFLLDALQRVISGLRERRHISGAELAEAVRGLALDRFGPMARTVLEYWGVRTTEDLGEIVFDLVDTGILVKDTTDRLEDFVNVFDFEEAFDHDYPWNVYPWKVATVCPWTVLTRAD